jgi:hypothetical protein
MDEFDRYRADMNEKLLPTTFAARQLNPLMSLGANDVCAGNSRDSA